MSYFSPVEFLDFAKALKVQSEKDARVCISRAYYAAHLSARQKIVSHFTGLFPPLEGGDDEHNIVREKLSDLNYDTIALNLLQLARKRVRADYDLHPFLGEESIDEPERAIKLCQTILSCLENV